MSDKIETPTEAAVCGVAGQGLTCAVVSWSMPLLAIAVLLIGLYYPVVSIFNLLVVAFGITALARSVARMCRFGPCGLGGHVAVGVVLNLAILVLVVFRALRRRHAPSIAPQPQSVLPGADRNPA